ncbi:hypothetical protein Y032_0043g755 [Ancylostoma ceylanicum]|nr:hypothetical protein Y032_0043g755 [Ancylostoma ceylanicum]
MRYRELRSILIRSVFGRIPIVKNRLSDLSSIRKPTRGGQSQVAPETTNQRRTDSDFLRQKANCESLGRCQERSSTRLPPLRNVPKNREPRF